MRLLLLGALVAACSSSTTGKPREGEVSSRALEMPPGAKRGMSITWRYSSNQRDRFAVFEETLACVGETPDRVTIEWRRRLTNRQQGVTAARFDKSGKLIGAWRGPPGEVGKAFKVVATGPQLDRVEQEVRWRARQLGFSLKNVEIVGERETGTVETPAGSFPCEIHHLKVTLPLSESTVTLCYAQQPLPLDRLVRMEWKLPRGGFSILELVEYSREGAKPTLRIPK
ncbi:MAG: hypothetical protein ACYTDU_11375 [Planctomycetota bacterium]